MVRVIVVGLRTAIRVVTRVNRVLAGAASKVVIKTIRVVVRRSKGGSMARRFLGLSLHAQWAINSKLKQTRENRVAARSSANASKESLPAVTALEANFP